MSSVNVIIGLGSLALVSTICEKISNSLGQIDIASYIHSATVGLGATTATTIIIETLKVLKSI